MYSVVGGLPRGLRFWLYVGFSLLGSYLIYLEEGTLEGLVVGGT